ncbi:MAG: GyrI-like domain-containing protein [Solirubrobacterales bacterium]
MTENAPTLENLPSQPYVAVRAEVNPETFRDVVDSSFGRPFAWLGERGIAPGGAPFIRYMALDDGGQPSLIEMGVPVAEPVEPGDGLVAGEVPAGRYVTYTHVGPFQHAELDDLSDAVGKVIAWARENDAELAIRDAGDHTEMAGSFEFYLVDPSAEPDFTKWETRIALLTDD